MKSYLIDDNDWLVTAFDEVFPYQIFLLRTDTKSAISMTEIYGYYDLKSDWWTRNVICSFDEDSSIGDEK